MFYFRTRKCWQLRDSIFYLFLTASTHSQVICLPCWKGKKFTMKWSLEKNFPQSYSLRNKSAAGISTNTPSIPEIIWAKNVRAIVVCEFLMKSLKKHILKIWKRSWVPFGSYLLDSTADSAQFEWKCFFKDFIKNPQTTIALTFLTHIISGIDGVGNLWSFFYFWAN